MKSKFILVAVTTTIVACALWYDDDGNSEKSIPERSDLEIVGAFPLSPIRLDSNSSIEEEAFPDFSLDLPSWIPDEKRKNLKWPFLCGSYTNNSDYLNSPGDSAEKLKRVEDEIDAHRQEVKNIAVQLSRSEDAEHLLMSALYGGPSASRVNFETLSKAMDVDRRHPLIAWHIMSACGLASTERFCLEFDVEQYAIDVSGENGELWGKIALERARLGNEDEALDAMRRANGAPNFTNYFVEHLQLFERGLAASTDYSEIERYTGAMGFAVAMVSSSSSVYRLCKEISIVSHAWRAECLQFGKRMEVDNKTIINSLIGLALQRQMYELAKNWTGVTDALDRENEVDVKFKRTLWTDTQTVIQYDPRVFSEYIAHWAAHGELAALQFAERETERLKGVPGYDPCEFVPTSAP